jgi:hypothetical protein
MTVRVADKGEALGEENARMMRMVVTDCTQHTKIASKMTLDLETRSSHLLLLIVTPPVTTVSPARYSPKLWLPVNKTPHTVRDAADVTLSRAPGGLQK